MINRAESIHKTCAHTLHGVVRKVLSRDVCLVLIVFDLVMILLNDL